NYHEANNSFPMGGSMQSYYLTYWQPIAKQGTGALAALLPYLGETAVYNSINFYFGVDESVWLANDVSIIQDTGIGAQIKEYMCPSDPLAGKTPYDAIARNTNNYYASVGTSTNQLNSNTNISTMANVPTTGLFGFQRCVSIAAVVDGTSNTV